MLLVDKIELKIYNISGELINAVAITELPAVINNKYVYEYEWEITNIVSGIYLYSVTAKKGNENTTKFISKITIIK